MNLLCNRSVLSLTSAVIIMFSISNCSPSPYFRSTLFDEIRLDSVRTQTCTMVVNADSIEYFICEPNRRDYQVKIIPSGEHRATMIVIPEIYISDDSFSGVIERELRQISISGEYLLQPEPNLKDLPRRIRLELYFKSIPGEKYLTEALFIVDRYILNERSGRDKLRTNLR